MTDQEILKAMENLLKPIKKDITNIRIILENETNRKIDIIGEGHDFLKRRLDGAISLEKDKERMELELMNLKMDIRKIKDKLDIA